MAQVTVEASKSQHILPARQKVRKAIRIVQPEVKYKKAPEELMGNTQPEWGELSQYLGGTYSTSGILGRV